MLIHLDLLFDSVLSSAFKKTYWKLFLKKVGTEMWTVDI